MKRFSNLCKVTSDARTLPQSMLFDIALFYCLPEAHLLPGQVRKKCVTYQPEWTAVDELSQSNTGFFFSKVDNNYCKSSKEGKVSSDWGGVD